MTVEARYERWNRGWDLTRQRLERLPSFQRRLNNFVDGWNLAQWKAAQERMLRWIV